ncbi:MULTISPECIES: FAD-binding and (Fe-S)-binding domain-containing protein [Rhizobium/Agrobacterium group]|uniref:D-2-hydroxyglutarate dehydrogenase n=2 Tax=Rhizobium/Agrobacterium group TaxID=227290 RepID=A0A9X3R0P1_9HYPH|nr:MULTISPECIES: FAD-binding and (Fe-S)-binding domain-containing protein [Rhizobium/Agrobacterium group]MBO9126234.1 FAD-binding oxidoreductase [Rhizobium sp. 16-488-2b]MBO9176818.1 FAD-binding oxidoreductase [Rhizobium sp. 16-488-2a]MBO9197387.1 FAD-binding oxidoreductase [Rhizobium sp. 16-449-1b]MCZ7466752.1 FAD-binding and (Fe-S)-binding domain-containing protein [Rhizobium rhizogenes]MCZ7939218.1 FAD-binding and (Fe-S)-binding domain-containing protein [Agrobacterium salinitolerans]
MPARETERNQQAFKRFSTTLVRAGFKGETVSDLGSLTVYSTDNSIYQVRPMGVAFPRSADDLVILVKCAGETGIPLSARGGGTGTNGQSLTSGVVVDLSRHMNGIEGLDLAAGTVTVQPGVVLNELNAFLEPHGYFFPPTVSTASRATIGGMIGTDASGKGSRIYGKTSDYLHSLEIVLSDGSASKIEDLDLATARLVAQQDSLVGRAYREVLRVISENVEEIASAFPKMNRGLTGYNLQSVLKDDGKVRLAYLLAGSEGTLAFTTSVTLRILRRPKLKALVPIRYAHFQTALEDVLLLLDANPSAVEIIDDKVLTLAQQDPVWSSIEAVLGSDARVAVGGLNFVEFLADDEDELQRKLDSLAGQLAQRSHLFIDWRIVTDSKLIAELWSLREKSVGLLGRLSPTKQGIAFVEDTAVPPERLPDFVREFRDVLDSHGVTYGMYGHADVGCLHVRPALNMRDPRDAALIRPISDAIASLSKKYGGLLWGEHGRGYRGEYSPFFFGDRLYRELCSIKRVFDPSNLFNPGKLASPTGEGIDAIDTVSFRGEFDRQIDATHAKAFDRALACNGNGACFNWDKSDPMCPSYKATRDRNQSPKGRAALIREWARLRSLNGTSRTAAELSGVEEALKQSLSTCLSCKACSSQCPIKVDIPSMKAQFLHNYYRRRRRPFRHHLLSQSENAFRIARRLPKIANIAKAAMSFCGGDRLTRLVDLPDFYPAKASRPTLGDPERLLNLPDDEKQRTVILLEDTFTSSFDGGVVSASYALLERLGYKVWREPPMANGKAAYVIGNLEAFEKTARAAILRQETLLATGISVIGIEPVTTLMHDHEYKSYRADSATSAVILTFEDFLLREIKSDRISISTLPANKQNYSLFLHCTEKTARPSAAASWIEIFTFFGADATYVPTGCCGMAGMFGHEIEHQAMSKKLFSMSWAEKLDGLKGSIPLITGFSCRCQTERLTNMEARHPVEALLQIVSGVPASGHALTRQNTLKSTQSDYERNGHVD